MTNTATVAANHLRSLITDLLRTAGTDATLPMLMGIRLHTDTFGDKTVVAGFSTDRFTAGQAHIDATGHLPETFLPSPSCKRALAVLKMIEPSALIELQRDGDHLAFAGDGLTVRMPTKEFDSLRFHRIVESLDDIKAAPGVVVAFEPRLMARFTAIAKDHREPLHVGHTTTSKPALVTIGDHYRGLLMPRREEAAVVPWFLAPSEHAARGQAQADKAAAEARAKRSAAAKKAAATRAAKRAAQTTSRAKRKAA